MSTPLDPCRPEVLYAASVYWAVMTITSIGYGDILPVTYFEYWLCSLLMMISSVIWAYMLGAACSIIMNMDPEQVEFEQRMDAFNRMAEQQKIPLAVRYRAREFIREERSHQKYCRSLEVANSLGSNIKGAIARHMASKYLHKIWYFKDASTSLLQEVAHHMKPHFYERREQVELYDNLCTVERGTVARRGEILVRGSFWGEDMIVCLELLRKKVPLITLTYCQIVALSREDLSDVLQGYPDEVFRFRRAAVVIAMQKAIKIYFEEKLANIVTPECLWIHRMFDKMGGPQGLTSSERSGSMSASERWMDAINRGSSCNSSPVKANSLCSAHSAALTSSMDLEVQEDAPGAHHFASERELPIGITKTLTMEDRMVAMQAQLDAIQKSVALLLSNQQCSAPASRADWQPPRSPSCSAQLATENGGISAGVSDMQSVRWAVGADDDVPQLAAQPPPHPTPYRGLGGGRHPLASE
eukprot:gnl/TRDRNA2_/TRDRNA2_140694_c1_seq1.p1 gnl/TRDRNA2_/TRDRNA2_140694_c1~~gnl/TRDRNA2_/TRDRNA2_140694_c1_seq1.p1  ORF type:complete len:513 (+),score=94.17 gnl/TRDRNA2_/TRDRNA2_140694_c1_seq1:128-1540(+)